MKTKPRWMQSVIKTAGGDSSRMPYDRRRRAERRAAAAIASALPLAADRAAAAPARA